MKSRLPLCILSIAFIAGCSSDDEETSTNPLRPDSDTPTSSGGAAGGGGAAGDSATGGSAGAAADAGAPAPDNSNLNTDAGLAATDDFTFFVTSRGVGANGGNFGGLDGADALCVELATAVGQGARTWRAFLSTDEVDARDRIGAGPWQGSDGVAIASSLQTLFDDGIPQPARALRDENGIALPTAIHDVVTGTDQDGRRLVGLNCAGWTSSLETDQTVVGHADGMGPQGVDSNFGWIRAHEGPTNCDQTGLAAGGGDGRIYCFAAD